MTREKENYNAFLLHFLERLNGCESIENKITESLTDICEYYGLKEDSFTKLMDFATSI